MINSSAINSSAINGQEILNPISLAIGEFLYLSDKKSTSFGITLADSFLLSESKDIGKNYGLAVSDIVKFSETKNITQGNLVIGLVESDLKLSDSAFFNLEKGKLVEDLISYYVNLLIMQYRDKPKAVAHVTALVKQAVCDNMASVIRDSFDIDTAIGAQLDVIGEYAGIKRVLKTFSTTVKFGDDDYRLLIKIKRASNIMTSSLYDLDKFIDENLSGTLKLYDMMDMSMSLFISSLTITDDMAQAIIENQIFPRPLGVSYSNIIYRESMDNTFSLIDYNYLTGNESGLNTYSSFDSSKTILTYEETI